MSEDKNQRLAHPTGAVVFATTHWSLVLRAKGGDETAAAAALSSLCQVYWAPLYAFLRRSGHSSHDAEDLVQAFFAKFLQDDFLGDVSQNRGRFRSFLLAALRNFVANHWRESNRIRRGGGQMKILLDVPEQEAICQQEMALIENPERIFDRRWAQTVVQSAAKRLQDEYSKSGRGNIHHQLQGFLGREGSAEDYQTAGKKLKIAPGAISVAVHRLRHRYRDCIRQEIADTVERPEEIDAEMRYLLELLLG